MPLRLALAQSNPCVGDLATNTAAVLGRAREAAAAGAQLMLTGELALTGLPLLDLALRRSVVDASRACVERLAADLAAAGLGDLVVVVGHLGEAERIDELVPPLPQSCASVLADGRVRAVYAKQRLSKYGPLDERRILTRGRRDLVLDLDGTRALVAIGDDLSHGNGPLARARQLETDLVLGLAGLPFELDGDDARLALLQRRAEVAGAPVALANLVGGTDELVLDGGSAAMLPDGALLGRAARLREDLLVIDVPTRERLAGQSRDRLSHGHHDATTVRVDLAAASDAPLPSRAPAEPMTEPESLWTALTLAVHDAVTKRGHERVVIGLSGGTDSAVVATLAVDALGASSVIGLLATTPTTPAEAVTDARELAGALGIELREVAIGGEAASLAATLGLDDAAAASLHYRLRGAVLMEVAEDLAALALTSTNKSELALGAATPYGDAAGDLAPLRDVPRSLVDALARWRNDRAAAADEALPIPAGALRREPSSHSRRRRDDLPPLPPYPVIDRVLGLALDERASRVDLIAAGLDEADVDAVLVRLDDAEPLRRLAPPGPQLTVGWFGGAPRVPIASRWRETPGHPERPDQPDHLSQQEQR